jgi:GNAT superfamily N-acetyltransferase
MAKDQTVIGITGKPIPKPRTAKQQYELEKKRRMEKHLGKNVGGVQYSSDVNPYYNPRARTFREFVEIAETITEAKRLKFVKMYHGTSASSADKIKKSGFNTSDVYTSTDRETATSFGQRKGEKTKTVAFRVPKKDINTPGKIMKTDGQRGVDKWGREHYSTVMNPDYAKKHITKEKEGVIDSPKIPKRFRDRLPANSRFKRRTQTQPKKKPNVSEAKEARPPKEVLSKIAKAYGRKHRGVNVDTSHSERTGNIRVDQLWVPPHLQGKGIGTRVMKGLGKYADKTGKKITLNQDPDPGKKKKLADFYKSHGFEANRGKKRDFSTSDTHIRHPQVRESIKLLDDAWIPPASKRLRGGTESPLSAARKKGTDVNKVRASVNRFAEPINNPRHPDIDYKKDDKTGTHTFTHKKHPIQVKYSAGDKPGTFIQNTTKTGETTDKVGAARAMQDIKKKVSTSARPGTEILSQPVGPRRASLNTNTQGMGPPNEKGIQGGIVRNRSPKQKARGAKPLDPVKHTGTYIDPNH